MEEDLKILTINELLSSGNYVIPIYQRNYAWGETEINQLIRDIYDFSKDDASKDYFIGSLVVFKRKEQDRTSFETIDGQQRLTTLNILLSVLHREFKDTLPNVNSNFNLNLMFDSRIKSTRTIQLISAVEKELNYPKSKDYTPEMQQAYEICYKQINSLIKKYRAEKFYNYLINHVKILRVSVPDDTNLNHYFEVMNTRGEQLEKHEILKARLMSKLTSDHDKSVFNRIWEAASDMERYVQYGFTPEERNSIFDAESWNYFKPDSFEELAEAIKKNIDEKSNKPVQNFKNKPTSIFNIVNYKGAFEINTDHKDEAPERFSSVINYQNFLLHVLRVQTKKDVSLDDKKLLVEFDFNYLKKNEAIITDEEAFVKQFGFNLLKIKYIFDKLIIKREFFNEKNGWSLKRLKRYKDNRVSYVNTFGEENSGKGENENADVLMLLSMFHVSAPTLIYKHWLNAALLYCFENFSSVNSTSDFSKSYRDYLYKLAQTYMLDRYLSRDEKEFYIMIYRNNGVPVNTAEEDFIDLDKLNKGTQVENFIFNYVDYILWKKQRLSLNNFEFSFRSSVEHYYPQNPVTKSDSIKPHICDMFGNLCLISRSKNSKLSNYMPTAKKEHYEKVEPDSLKQQSMMQFEGKDWDEDKIKEQTQEMNKIILENLKKI